jgi:hypothetical protein
MSAARKAEPGAECDTEGRPTLVPEFDVEQLARDSDRWDPRRNGTPSAESGILPKVKADAPSVSVRAADVYWGRLGGPQSVPVLLVALDEVPAELREHCEGFLLCRIDGARTFKQIFADSGLPELTALSLACDLLDACIIGLAQMG